MLWCCCTHILSLLVSVLVPTITRTFVFVFCFSFSFSFVFAFGVWLLALLLILLLLLLLRMLEGGGESERPDQAGRSWRHEDVVVFCCCAGDRRRADSGPDGVGFRVRPGRGSRQGHDRQHLLRLHVHTGLAGVWEMGNFTSKKKTAVKHRSTLILLEGVGVSRICKAFSQAMGRCTHTHPGR